MWTSDPLRFGLLLLAGLISGVICEASTADTNNSNSTSTKTKRGIFNLGYGGIHPGLQYAFAQPPHAPVLTYGLSKPFLVSPYAKFPGLVKGLVPSPTLIQPPQFAITPGDAVVSSYNVNYPRYPILPQKPILFGSTLPRPLIPTVPTTVVVPQKPIIPVAVPAFSNHVPLFSPKPPFTPTYSFVPSIPAAPAAFPIQPQIIPIPLPAQPPTVSTIPATTTFFTNTQSDPWRPVIVANPTPTTTFNRPAISLLPPYGGGSDQKSAHLELYNSFPPNDIPSQLSQLYQSQENNAAHHHHHHHHLSDQDFIQGMCLSSLC